MNTVDFEAAHNELFGAMFLDTEYVGQYDSVTTVEIPWREVLVALVLACIVVDREGFEPRLCCFERDMATTICGRCCSAFYFTAESEPAV